MSKLTATAVVKAKPKAKQYKLADSGGMYLQYTTMTGITSCQDSWHLSG
jgi:hypothetical protein